MPSSRGRLAAAGSMSGSAMVVAAFLLASREAAREYWTVRQLRSADQQVVAECLAWIGEHGSLRAIPGLLDLAEQAEAPEGGRLSFDPCQPLWSCVERGGRGAASCLER